ncbi:MAG: NADPH:quinone reductase [Streptosporangiales bacterium]
MKAALYDRNGPADEVLRVTDVDTPEPGPGEVRVRITASAVNPTDWKARSGATPMPMDGFQVPNQDGVGVVDAVGEGVDPGKVGERAWLMLAAYNNKWGTAAEYSVLDADRAIPLPDGISDELGASLGVPAVTAAHCLGDRHNLAGRPVLVAGGAGAVGHYAIELAKHARAEVVTTVSSAEKGELARAAGADLVVNYRDDDAVDQIKALTPTVDRVVEVALGANMDLDLALAAPNTVITTYAGGADDPAIPVRRLMASNATLHFVLLYLVPPQEIAAAVRWVSDALRDDALSELPVQRFGLDETAAAHDAVEHGAVGKVLITP